MADTARWKPSEAGSARMLRERQRSATLPNCGQGRQFESVECAELSLMGFLVIASNICYNTIKYVLEGNGMSFEDDNKEFYEEVKKITRIEKEIRARFKWRNCCLTQKTIYHYTSPLGLLGIVSDRTKLWFSRYDCLNDKLEGRFVYTVYRDTVNRLLKSNKISEDFCQLVQSFKFNSIEFFPCKVEDTTPEGVIQVVDCMVSLEYQSYLCCFSTNWDSLPNWNYYSKDVSNRGYNVGFATDELTRAVATQGCYLLEFKKIQYGESVLKKQITELMLAVYQRRQELGKDGVLHVISSQLFEWLLTTKSDHFKHEQEVRAILKVPLMIPAEVKKEKLETRYRTINGYIVPYVELEFNKECVSEITLGPLLDLNTALNGVKQLRDDRGYTHVKINASKIQLRY